MSDDDDLFKGAYARSTDPDTSHDAADSLNKGKRVARLENLVYANVKYTGNRGATCQDVVEMTGLEWNTVSPRFARLLEKDLIEVRKDENGKTITRPGLSGHAQRVYFAKK